MTEKRFSLRRNKMIAEEEEGADAPPPQLIDVSAHTSGELCADMEDSSCSSPLSSEEIAAFPTLLGLPYKQSSNNQDNDEASTAFVSFFETNAGQRVAAARLIHILHHSLLRGPSLDVLREILEQVREQSAALIIPSSCLYHLAETTADVASVCGRRPFLGVKRRALRAIFESLRDDNSVVIIPPEEEAALRFHDGFADGDSMVWEVKSWLESRIPQSKIVVACDEDSRARYRFQVFRRNVLATEKVEERLKELPELVHENALTSSSSCSSSSTTIHPIVARARGIVSREQNGGDDDDVHEESHAPRTVPGTNRELSKHVGMNDLVLEPYEQAQSFAVRQEIEQRFVSRFRIRDPTTNRKFQPGMWRSGNRDEVYVQQRQRWMNQLPDVKDQHSSRRLAGHASGAVFEDLRSLGISTPGHSQH